MISIISRNSSVEVGLLALLAGFMGGFIGGFIGGFEGWETDSAATRWNEGKPEIFNGQILLD